MCPVQITVCDTSLCNVTWQFESVSFTHSSLFLRTCYVPRKLKFSVKVSFFFFLSWSHLFQTHCTVSFLDFLKKKKKSDLALMRNISNAAPTSIRTDFNLHNNYMPNLFSLVSNRITSNPYTRRGYWSRQSLPPNLEKVIVTFHYVVPVSNY